VNLLLKERSRITTEARETPTAVVCGSEHGFEGSEKLRVKDKITEPIKLQSCVLLLSFSK